MDAKASTRRHAGNCRRMWYYDRTHLTNDFKLLTGDTPTDFRKKSIFYVSGKDNLRTFADY